MAAVQEISARLGRTTGHGIAGNLRKHYPRWLLFSVVFLLFCANVINLAADKSLVLRDAFRVLKPGGRAIVGVPNRHDPFLRPLLATVLQAFGVYAYGYEKSYSRRALRAMLQRAGFTVVAETAILFIPGWLRMLDLACHTWCRPLAAITGMLVRPFVFLDRHVPAVRRHGYLLATVVMKPV
jgi:SAM-dependent methyltransferase